MIRTWKDARWMAAALLVGMPVLAGSKGAVDYRLDGAAAQLTGCEGTVCGGLDVQQGLLSSQSVTLLWFYAYDSATDRYTYGYGTIPNADFVASATAWASLDTDTSGNADIEVVECVASDCARVPGGRITAQWARNGLWSQQETTHRTDFMESVRRMVTGVYRWDSASVSASIVGRPFGSASGAVGSVHAGSVTVEPGP